MRQPLIRFRYGARGAINQALGLAHAATSTAGGGAASEAADGAAPAMAQFKSQLPDKFRPRTMSDEELDTINLGGAKPYAPKAWRKRA